MRKITWFFILIFLIFYSANLALAQNQEILLLEAEGPVTPAMASYFERGIRKAEERGATAVLITLDTPGGNIDPMQDIVRLFRAPQLPGIGYLRTAGAGVVMLGQLEGEWRLRAQMEAAVARRAETCGASISAVKTLARKSRYAASLGKGYWNRCAKAYLQF